MTVDFTFEAIDEAWPGDKWRRRFVAKWPEARAWYLGEGDDARPSLAACRAALTDHMPEIVPVWERMCALAGDDEVAHRYLTGWGLPGLFAGCSVSIWDRGEPQLTRNYDFNLNFFTGVVQRNCWRDRTVIVMSEAAWGALDGLNDRGLATCLTFGGRPDYSHEGFAIPFVVRYALEVCDTVAEAASVLTRLPVNHVQNVALLNRAGDHRVVYMAPDRDAVVRRVSVTTNHQLAPEWPEHDSRSRTVERAEHLLAKHAEPKMTAEALATVFFSPPLYVNYADGFGTLYTAVYRPAQGSVTFRWPDEDWGFSFGDFTEGTRRVRFRDGQPATAAR